MNRHTRRLSAALLMVLGNLAPAQPAQANPQKRLEAVITSIGVVRTAPLTPLDVSLVMRSYGFRVLWHQTHSLTPAVCTVKREVWLNDSLVVPLRFGECRVRLWAVSTAAHALTRRTRATVVLLVTVRPGPVHEGDLLKAPQDPSYYSNEGTRHDQPPR